MKETIGIRDAAIKSNLSLTHLYNLVRLQKLPAKKIGRQWHISAEAIDALMKRGA